MCITKQIQNAMAGWTQALVLIVVVALLDYLFKHACFIRNICLAKSTANNTI